jgi:hypothetical protein
MNKNQKIALLAGGSIASVAFISVPPSLADTSDPIKDLNSSLTGATTLAGGATTLVISIATVMLGIKIFRRFTAKA